MTKLTLRVLGVHPSSYGFGYVYFEDEHTPFDWRCIDVLGDKNAGSLRRLEKLLQQYRPDVLAMEAFEDKASNRSSRIRNLCRAASALAQKKKIAVRIYSKDKIGTAMGLGGSASREAIAGAVAERVQSLRPRIPNHRRAWEGEHSSMALFCAAACALADYASRS